VSGGSATDAPAPTLLNRGVDPGTAWKGLAVVDFAVPGDGWP
jgi:hypothetical protein